MITGTHAIIYAQDAERARAFFRDVLGWPHVDAHGGWLIFRMPPAELGIHPTGDGAGPDGGPSHGGPPNGHQELYLMCDDIAATMAELAAKGAEFTAPPQDLGFGVLARLQVPGAGEIGIYEPRHPTAYDLED